MRTFALAVLLVSGCSEPPGKKRKTTPTDTSTSTTPTLTSGTTSTTTPVPADPPNLLLVVLDDLGADSVRGFGDDNPITMPRLDELAARGTRLTNAYASPVCTPTRAELLTGRWSHRSGLTAALSFNDTDVAGLPDTEITVAAALKDRGYTSVIAGKWHLATLAEHGADHPMQVGFDHHRGSMGNLSEDHSIDGLDMEYTDWEKSVDGVIQRTTVYATTDNADDAIAWMQTLPEPWLVVLSFNAGHAPWHEPPAHLVNDPIPPYPGAVDLYPAAVQAMDTELGRVLDNTPEDTWITVLGDNGSPEEIVGPRGKGSMFETGIRVPMVVAGPGLAQNRDLHDLVAVVDVFPTLLELAEVSVPAVDIDGVSLLPLLRGELTQPHREWVYSGRASPIHAADPDGYGRMVRDERYKLVLAKSTVADPVWGLFDLYEDPGELTNLMLSPLDDHAQDAHDALKDHMDDVLEL